MADAELPLFPLNTVLFPQGPLPLRIFETRYLDMVSACLKGDFGFGVCLIQRGAETGPAEFCEIGCEATIRDWGRGNDGILNLVAVGQRRFRVLEHWRAEDGLHWGRLRWLDEAPPMPLPEVCEPIGGWLEEIWADLPDFYRHVATDYENAAWVANRATELLPLNPAQKQHLLELDNPLERLHVLLPLIQSLARRRRDRT